jgi:hypothetical protein
MYFVIRTIGLKIIATGLHQSVRARDRNSLTIPDLSLRTLRIPMFSSSHNSHAYTLFPPGIVLYVLLCNANMNMRRLCRIVLDCCFCHTVGEGGEGGGKGQGKSNSVHGA